MTTMNVYDMTDTWTAGATTYSAIKMNVTDTASNANSLLMDLQVGGSSKAVVTKGGTIKFGNLQALSAGGISGYDAVGNLLFVADSAFNLRNQLALSNNAPGSPDLYITRAAAASAQLGAADAAAPVAQTLQVQSVVAGTTDTAGTDFTIQGSRSTGTGAPGNIVFKTGAKAASTASTQNAAATLLTLGPSSLLGSDATSGFNLSQTWNTSGTPTAALVAVTDTASNAGSFLMRMTRGGNDQYSFNKLGQIKIYSNSYNANTYLAIDNSSGNAFIRYSNNSFGVTFTIQGDTTGSGGPATFALGGQGTITWQSTARQDTGTADTILSRGAAASLQLGAADAASPVAQTLQVQSVVAGTADTAGTDFTIQGSRSTGTGAPGNIVFKTGAKAASTASTQNAAATLLTLGPSSLLGSDATSGFSMVQTWNTSGTPTAIKLNVTNTASNASSLLLDLQVGGSTVFNISRGGVVTSSGGVTIAAGTSYLISARGGLGSSGNGQFQLFNAGFAANVNLTVSTNDILQFGAADASSAVAQTLQVQSVVAGTSNTAGADWTIQGSRGTGTGAGGKLLFKTAAAGGSGSTQNSASTALQITTTQSVEAISPTGGLGYGTGAGGTVTQITSRTTGVTINKVCGAITLVSAAGSTTIQAFTVTNSTVAATDTITVVQKSGTDRYRIYVTAVGAGSFEISYATLSGTTTEQPVFNFSVIKAVAA